MSFRHFYDLPVYRLPRADYYRDRDEYVEKILFPTKGRQAELVWSMAETDPDILAAWRSTIERSYGGCWEFNEIIGYVRLHFLGAQVRGEYFGSSMKRILRSRSKRFEYQTWKFTPELDIEPPYGKPQILSAVREYIEDCRKELPRRHIDASTFEKTAPYVDWESLFQGRDA